MANEVLNLQPMDLVAYKAVEGQEQSAFYRFIRSMSGRKNTNNKEAPVHTGIVIPINGVNKIVEMKFKDGLVANDIDFEQDRFIGVTRLDITEKQKQKIAKDVKKDLKNGIKYSKGTMAPAYIYKNKNKKELKDSICSEYVARKIDTNTDYKAKDVWHRITPAELARDGAFKRNGKNQGVYIPREELIKKAFQDMFML